MRALLLIPTLLTAQSQTVPERTTYARTSTVAEVQAFMDGLAKDHPQLAPWRPMEGPKVTESGAPLLAWRLASTASNPLRIYLNGNIHAGEVEGKEALQEMARELAEGRYPDLRRLECVFMPCYNAEGTDALDPAIRRHQPNPASGVGRRETDRGLDLNRDAMKAEAASTKWYLAMLRSFDPHVVFDLHTTNGSYHGFHLTYAPALTLGGDPGLLAFNRRLVNEVRDGLAKEGMPTYDYGNYGPDERGRTTPERWESYDPFPRYLLNHAGLTGRLAILSEAYVYRSFPERIADTKRYLLACLRWIAAHAEEVKKATTNAQAARPERLPLAAKLSLTERRAFDVIDPIKDEFGKLLGEKGRRRLELPSYVTFEAVPDSLVTPPAGFLVHPAFAAEVKALLEAQGIRTAPGSARPALPLRHFQETGRTVAPKPFQGILNLDLQGGWGTVPAKGTAPWSVAQLDSALWVSLDQPQGRLAFYLLDPRSPDGLVHWGRFHSVLLRGGWGEAPAFPILAVGGPLDPEPVKAAPAVELRKPE